MTAFLHIHCESLRRSVIEIEEETSFRSYGDCTRVCLKYCVSLCCEYNSLIRYFYLSPLYFQNEEKLFVRGRKKIFHSYSVQFLQVLSNFLCSMIVFQVSGIPIIERLLELLTTWNKMLNWPTSCLFMDYQTIMGLGRGKNNLFQTLCWHIL